MKLYKTISFFTLSCLVSVSCSDINNQFPEGGDFTQDQMQETNETLPERMNATFSGMFSMMGEPYGVFGSQERADDFGFIMAALSLDAEGADLSMADNNYNWFSAACNLSSRDANYANPYIRYVLPYRQVGTANEIVAGYPEDTEDQTAIYQIAQAKAMRAFDYLSLAPYFQFGYTTSPDADCIPLLTDGIDYTNNPRASVSKVYETIIEDLNYAIDHLEGYDRGTDKTKINLNVAYGLRARAYLNMGLYAEAAADAEKAQEGFTPASISEVSVPAFCDLNEHNWIWAIDITDDMANKGGYATPSSWISAFSGDGYAPACQCTPFINKLLYDKISTSDVRKGWWLDENLESPNIANLSWTGVSGGVTVTATGNEIPGLVLDDGSKIAFLPYTNVKFGMKSGVGSTLNNNDWPLMRVEEMILIQAEGLAKSGNEGQARTILENFVRTYRDPSYTVPSSATRSLADEIWFQRRVELWGEGFYTNDAKRLGKPIVRMHDNTGSTNFPTAFAFNIAADDGWLNMRFPQTEMDNNLGIVDNTGGKLPESGQNGSLRDGVTD